jgi:two-component system CheB/CheR fusion protein
VRERARELIGRQVQHLARLVDDLLEVSRITQRKVDLQRSVVKLATILEAAVEVVRPVLEASEHTLVVSLPDEDLWLDVDAVRMSQVVGNLLHNAAKFTPRGGRVALEALLAGPMLEIRVADNGVGISPELLPTVFDLFSQADRSLERSQGGLGIGLSLVKGLVEMHGGTVSASSAGHAGGSVFTICLPLEKLLAKEPPPQATRPREVSSSPRRILVVEDNVDSAEAMLLLLRGIGHDVTVVSDGREAVDVAKQLQPEIILLDIGLPGMDGYELARRLRDMPETRAARLIAVSGYGQQKDRARSRDAGFDTHLVKPVDPSTLTEAINAVSDPREASALPVG